MDKKKHKKPPKVVKPYLTGAAVDRTFLSGVLKFFFSTLVMVFAFLVVGVMMQWDSLFLNILINGVVLFTCYLIFYQTGATSGADAVNQGEIMYHRQEKDRPVEPWEREMCFHPAKGIIVALVGSIPLLVCSVILALTAQRQMTTLGALPSWMSTLEGRVEIGGALAYYHETGSMSLEAAMRLIIRMSIMPYVNMVGAANKDAMLILERVSPLLNLLPALMYGIGYMGGVNLRSTVHTNIAVGKRRAKKKQRKEQAARSQRRGPEQLN